MCAHVSSGFNASHHVCTSTTACMSKHIYYSVLRPCLHVRTFLHCLRSLHVCTCQSRTQALCSVDNNLSISCHNSCIGMYIHVSISFNPSQHLSCTSLCTFTPKSNHLWTSTLHVSICAFDLSTNAWVHVNRKHYALSKIT